MAYKATVIPVTIVSPGDVTEEREIILKNITRWVLLLKKTFWKFYIKQLPIAPVQIKSKSNPV